LTFPYRFTAVLATIALAVGGGTAFAHGGHRGGGGDDNHGDRNGRQDDRNGRDNDRHGGRILTSALFGSNPLTGNPAGFALFGVNPGGAPWVIGNGEAKVKRDGRVKVEVEGLVIPTPPQNGTNPLSNIAASVFCNGKLVGTTAAVPFSTDGNAEIDATLTTPIPSPCLVPAVLLNPAPGGVVNAATYIAATGA
jgi:hypothetical protein